MATQEHVPPIDLTTLCSQAGGLVATRVAVAEADGDASDAWGGLTDRVLAGDELWRLRSPEERWRNLCGTEFLALVRQGLVVRTRLTRMN